MTVAEAIEFYTTQIKYKPNFGFVAEENASGGVSFGLKIHVEDSTRPGTTTDLVYRSVLSKDWIEGNTFEALANKVFEWIEDYEVHEAREWFEVGGAKIFFPHGTYGEVLDDSSVTA